MRGTWALPVLAIAILASAVLTPSATADHPDEHGEARCDDEVFFHLCLDVQDLAPGVNRTRNLLSPEGPLRAGWVYIIYGGLQGEGTVIADLERDGEPVESFVWTGGQYHKNSTKIKDTGNHTLTLRNPGNETVRYAFYYDQSCNCAGKLIPLPGGFVLFNYDFPADTDVSIKFPLVDGWGLSGAVATLKPSATDAKWPTDFDILQEAEHRDTGWLEFDVHTGERGTYYVFLEATAGASPQDPIHLTPVVEVEEEAEKAPPVGVAMTLLATAASLFFVRRRR